MTAEALVVFTRDAYFRFETNVMIAGLGFVDAGDALNVDVACLSVHTPIVVRCVQVSRATSEASLRPMVHFSAHERTPQRVQVDVDDQHAYRFSAGFSDTFAIIESHFFLAPESWRMLTRSHSESRISAKARWGGGGQRRVHSGVFAIPGGRQTEGNLGIREYDAVCRDRGDVHRGHRSGFWYRHSSWRSFASGQFDSEKLQTTRPSEPDHVSLHRVCQSFGHRDGRSEQLRHDLAASAFAPVLLNVSIIAVCRSCRTSFRIPQLHCPSVWSLVEFCRFGSGSIALVRTGWRLRWLWDLAHPGRRRVAGDDRAPTFRDGNRSDRRAGRDAVCNAHDRGQRGIDRSGGSGDGTRAGRLCDRLVYGRSSRSWPVRRSEQDRGNEEYPELCDAAHSVHHDAGDGGLDSSENRSSRFSLRAAHSTAHRRS